MINIAKHIPTKRELKHIPLAIAQKPTEALQSTSRRKGN